MNLFDYDEYRSYLRDYIKQLPRSGRGELAKISKYLNINSTWMSQIMSGSQDLNLEQGFELSNYLGHLELETEYFNLLIQISRAANFNFKKHLSKKLESIRLESQKISKVIKVDKQLSEIERSQFYSSWIYSAIHIFTSLFKNGVSLDEICSKFRINKIKAASIVSFLCQSGILVEVEGKLMPGVQSTFLEFGSPHLLKHLSSWRIKAIEYSDKITESELMISGQYSLSKKDFMLMRELFVDLVKELNHKVKNTEPEEIVCFNLDWFYLKY